MMNIIITCKSNKLFMYLHVSIFNDYFNGMDLLEDGHRSVGNDTTID